MLYCATGLLFFSFIAYLNHSLDDHVSLDSKQSENNVKREVKNLRKDRINMQTYVPPPPCVGCPGENGAAVHLTVI